MSSFADLVRFNPVAGGTTDWVVSSAVGGCQTPALANVLNGVSYKVYAVSNDLTQWEVSQGVYNSGTTTFPRTTVLYNSSGTGTATGQSGAGTKINFSTIPQVSLVALAEDLKVGITRQYFTTAGAITYTPTSKDVVQIEVELIGAGGGGGGSGSSGGGAGGNGTASTFNAGAITAPGGTGAAGGTSAAAGAGGVAGVGGDISVPGGSGGSGDGNIAFGPAGVGGPSAKFSGGGFAGVGGSAGGNAATNSGGGGGGGAPNTGVGPCGGGGGGAYTNKIMAPPSTTYSGVVGTKGSAGSPGTSGFAGGTGADGMIIVTERYN